MNGQRVAEAQDALVAIDAQLKQLLAELSTQYGVQISAFAYIKANDEACGRGLASAAGELGWQAQSQGAVHWMASGNAHVNLSLFVVREAGVVGKKPGTGSIANL